MGLPAEKLEERKHYLGGSDAPAVVGLSRWKTPLDVWAEKVGAVSNDKPETLPQKLGKRFEEVVAELFTEATGKKVRRVNEALHHKQYPFLAANIDRRVVGENAVLECKTCSPFKSKEWAGDEIPEEYIVQVMHYLAVTGAERGYIAILIGNTDFKWKEIRRDETAIAALVKAEVQFWNEFVVPGVMPKIVKAADSDTLQKLFPGAGDGSVVNLPKEADQLLEMIEALSRDVSATEAQLEQRKNELKLMMGNNEVGLAGSYRVSWKPQTSHRLNTKSLKANMPDIYAQYAAPITSRVFRYATREAIANGND